MSHFAEIDKDGNVLRVIVAEQDFIDSGLVGDPKNWIQTSYNNNFRTRFAGIGYKYDKDKDAFLTNKPYESWTLDNKTLSWKAPVEKQKEEDTFWDEKKKLWVSELPKEDRES